MRYRNYCPPSEATTVSFKDEPLVYCYSDLQDENFLFEKDADSRLRLWMVDFEHASFLPISFLSFAVAVNRWWPTIPIAARLSLPQRNVEVMKDISYIFMISASGMGMTEEQRNAKRRGEHREG